MLVDLHRSKGSGAPARVEPGGDPEPGVTDVPAGRACRERCLSTRRAPECLRMRFDQYHEPPAELPAETRTFARLCASLTEEAEAIGWYEQRMAVESDREARAIMRDAQGEEFKHFCMDLEFLLRRTPLWREIAAGILFQEGDIVEHGEEAEEEAVEGAAARGAPLAGSASLGIGSLKGRRVMSHLLREHAPITEAGWSLIDDEARERLTPALAARKLIDFAGPHGWEHSATNLGRTRPLADAPVDGVTAAQRRVLAVVELRAPFSLARSELRDADRGAEDVELAALDEAAHRIATAENRAVFHGWEAAGITGIAEASTHEPIALGDDCERYPRHVARAVEALLAARHRRPVRPRARTRRVYERARDQRARRLPAVGAPAQDRRRPARMGPRRGRRGRREPARRRLPPRGGRGPLGRLRAPRRRRRRRSTSKRASPSASPRRRRRWRSR